MLRLTEALSTDSAVVGLAVHAVDQVYSQLGQTSELKVARRAGITFIPRVIFHVDYKMLGITEVISTDSAVVGLAVYVVDQVHS
jgi:hypothetical protein